MVVISPKLADIFRYYEDEYRSQHKLSVSQDKAFRAITQCRTAKLGARKEVCTHCGHSRISYNSCRNRHCPQCQFVKREKWIQDRKEELLDTHYFHVVFTVPDTLKPIFLYKPKLLYRILFKASADTIMAACIDPKHLGAQVGVVSVLHTWGQKLQFHPHIHSIISGGGLADATTKWVKSRKKYLVPVKVLSSLFRGKFLDYLSQENLEIPKSKMTQLYAKDWVVYSKPAFAGPDKVIEYLGRYTHRVALNNSRILKVEKNRVSFRFKDYADNSKQKVTTLSALEFIRRFMMHVLPTGTVRIRYSGFLSNSTKKSALVKIRALLNMAPQIFVKMDWQKHLIKLFSGDLFKCPHCNEGRFVRKEFLLTGFT